MTRIALFVLCLCVSGCASMPLSTIIRMSTFDEHDFAKLDAEVVRVRITLPDGFDLNVAKSWLGVEIKSAAGVHDATFELDQVLAQVTRLPGGIFSRTEQGTAYVLRLSAPSKAKFRELQAFVARGRANEINIRVGPRLSSSPREADLVKVWIDLLLSETQGYFTLLNAAKVPLEKIREQSTGS